MVNFDNFGGLTSVLNFHIFLILTVKNWYVFVSSAKDWFDFSQMWRTGTQFSQMSKVCVFELLDIDVNEINVGSYALSLHEQEIFLLRPCRNFASLKQGFLECLDFKQ